jgi:hypothetical protein
MAIDDAYRLTVTAQMSGQFFQNSYALNVISTTEMNAGVFAAAALSFKEVFRQTQNSGLVYRSWRAVQLRGTGVTAIQNQCRTEGGSVFEGTFTSSTSGGATAVDPLPHQCALVVTLNTGLAGRRKRGRLYVPGFSEPDQAVGAWLSSIVTTWGTALNTVKAKYMGAGATDPDFRWGIWSFRTATGCERDPHPPYGHIQIDSPNLAAAWTRAEDYVIRSPVFTQRRRVIGVGR